MARVKTAQEPPPCPLVLLLHVPARRRVLLQNLCLFGGKPSRYGHKGTLPLGLAPLLARRRVVLTLLILSVRWEFVEHNELVDRKRDEVGKRDKPDTREKKPDAHVRSGVRSRLWWHFGAVI